MGDARVRALRREMRKRADARNAAYHKAYHKTPLRVHGLTAARWTEAMRAVFPRRERLDVADAKRLAAELWASQYMEERSAAIGLLARVARDLTVRDVPLLRRMTHGCHGWALLDGLADGVLGPLALARGEPVYRGVRAWSRDRDLWTRRASILVHVIPARRGELAHAYAWPTFEELLPERDFFVRKAIGWALRECGKRYPEHVAAFLIGGGGRASGLTRREGARRLPPRLRRRILGP